MSNYAIVETGSKQYWVEPKQVIEVELLDVVEGQKEIAAASDEDFRFIPFNHDSYLDPHLYIRGQLLDNLYFARDSGLMKLYSDFEKIIRQHQADAVIVDNCFPYHPDYLRKIPIYKVLRTSDGAISAGTVTATLFSGGASPSGYVCASAVMPSQTPVCCQ